MSDFMTAKERETQLKIIAAHSNRDDVKRLAGYVQKLYELLNQGDLIDESSISVDRKYFKSVLVALKLRHELDVLTIKRGYQTVGWILASEVL